MSTETPSITPEPTPAPKDVGGRPSAYTEAIAQEVCQRLAEGESLRSICKDKHMPVPSTIYLWVIDDREGFSKQYARARAIQAENMFEEILDISDDNKDDWMTVGRKGQEFQIENKEVTNRSRLRVDSRKWYLSKVLPKKFGDKVDVTSDGKAIQGNTIILKSFKADATNSK